MPGKSPVDPVMSALGRIGAHVVHARYDPRETTAKARAAYKASFEAAADPEGVLSSDERTRRAEHLRRAHYARLAYKSAVARRKRAAGKGHAR